MGEEISLTRTGITAEEFAGISHLLRRSKANAAVEAFEEAEAAAFDRTCCISATSGGIAIELALAATGIGPGDEVILPAIGARSAAAGAQRLGATVQAVDVDPRTLCMRVEDAEAAISERTKVMVASSALGCPAGMDELSALATRSELPMIEIVGPSIGGNVRGERSARFGRMAVIDLGQASPLSTESGGLILTHDDHLDALLRDLRNGRRAIGPNGRLASNAPGYDAPLDDVRAALGLVRLGKLDSVIARRAEMAGSYIRALSGHSDLIVQTAPEGVQMGWSRMLVRLSDRFSVEERDEIIEGLARHDIIGDPLIELAQHSIAPTILEGQSWPVAERATDRAISLPFHDQLREREIDLVAQTLELMITRTSFRRDDLPGF